MPASATQTLSPARRAARLLFGEPREGANRRVPSLRDGKAAKVVRA